MSTKTDLIDSLTESIKHGLKLLLIGDEQDPPDDTNQQSEEPTE